MKDQKWAVHIFDGEAWSEWSCPDKEAAERWAATFRDNHPDWTVKVVDENL